MLDYRIFAVREFMQYVPEKQVLHRLRYTSQRGYRRTDNEEEPFAGVSLESFIQLLPVLTM